MCCIIIIDFLQRQLTLLFFIFKPFIFFGSQHMSQLLNCALSWLAKYICQKQKPINLPFCHVTMWSANGKTSLNTPNRTEVFDWIEYIIKLLISFCAAAFSLPHFVCTLFFAVFVFHLTPYGEIVEIKSRTNGRWRVGELLNELMCFCVWRHVSHRDNSNIALKTISYLLYLFSWCCAPHKNKSHSSD